MAIKNKRLIYPYETRDFKVDLIKSEINETTGKKYLFGFIPYNSKSENMGFYEVITPSAFKKSLQEANIVALVGHDPTKVLGSTKAGTLQLESKEDGLYITCEIPDTTYANDAYSIINRGDVRTMSFGFTPVKVDTVGDIDYLIEVKLHEVSFMVTFPAYSETESIATTRQRMIKEKRGIDLQKLSSILVKENFDDDDKNFLSEVAKKVFASIDIEVEERTNEQSPEEVINTLQPVETTVESTELTSLKQLVELESFI